MCFGGETKDQDRVYWSNATSTAAVTDGVTSSPFSAEGAELVARASPILFRNENHLEDNLRAIADMQVMRRLEAQEMPVKTLPDTPKAMQAILQEVGQASMMKSFQTTLIAAAFIEVNDVIISSVVSVGDSAFFAFSPAGDLLVTSLPIVNREIGNAAKADSRANEICVCRGEELLVKVICSAAQRPQVARQADIKETSAENWLICAPLDHCRNDGSANRPYKHKTVCLRPSDLLLIPKYLTEIPHDPRYHHYRRVRYSQAIRSLTHTRPRQIPLQEKSHATAVLPDHFYTGDWSYFQERFPKDAQFVLASDGFYSCFSNPPEIWTWLNENTTKLRNKHERGPLLKDLHRKLHNHQGDDDISFVWIQTHLPAGHSLLGPNARDEGEHHARRTC